MAETITIGIEIDCVVDLKKALEEMHPDMFDFLVTPLVHPKNERQLHASRLAPRNVPLTRSDLLLPAPSWSSYVVAKISSWLNFDSEVHRIQMNSRLAFKQELAWATHLSLTACLLPVVEWKCDNYAAVLLSTLLNSYMPMWVEVPLVSKSVMLYEVPANQLTQADDPWENWNKLRTLCQHHTNLHVALEITSNVPDVQAIDRWVAEPLSAVILPTDVFLTNQKGFPVLSKKHQDLLCRLFKYNIQVVLRGVPRHPSGKCVYQQYITWLWKQTTPMTELERYEKPYWDYLQSPLQPLMDNLESQTYETFEKDPVKYQKYEEAITACLAREPTLKGKPEVILMVLGAGRGPLVFAAMRAAKATNRKIRLFALEKNPNAVNTLFNLRDSHPDWEGVTVINTDIRNWQPTEKADVIVSELLGSFGDNELSPECLYGAQHILKEGGISIPADYTSYIAPLSSVKLYNEVSAFNNSKNFETAYVVKFHAVNVLTEAQPCFTFVHPNYSEDRDCTRSKRMTFKIDHSALIHGFAGFFESKLYDNVTLSIHPPTFTPSMFSWFPLFFPLRSPVYVPGNSELVCDFWRLTDGKKVWYEWVISHPQAVPIHNPNGRSWWIGL